MKKKKPNWFIKTLSILFVIFMGLFIACKSGYYESKVNKQVGLTSDAIKQFEEDVLNGKMVDINSYIEVDTNDYSNKFTRSGEKIANTLSEFFSQGIKDTWDIIKVLFL